MEREYVTVRKAPYQWRSRFKSLRTQTKFTNEVLRKEKAKYLLDLHDHYVIGVSHSRRPPETFHYDIKLLFGSDLDQEAGKYFEGRRVTVDKLFHLQPWRMCVVELVPDVSKNENLVHLLDLIKFIQPLNFRRRSPSILDEV